MRLYPCISAVLGREMTFLGPRRSVADLDVLNRLGAQVRTTDGFPPVHTSGRLEGGEAEVDASVTSQVLSGLLFALPLAPRDSVLRLRGLTSRPYAEMTLDVVRAHGVRVAVDLDWTRVEIPGRQTYRPASIPVEGDWSAAALLLVAGAIAGRVRVLGLDPASRQGDRAILGFLPDVEVSATAVVSSRGSVDAFDTDVTDCPDLLPPLAVLATCANGTSRVRGVGRLSGKESDRPRVLARELGRLGARVQVREDGMEIGGAPLRGGDVDCWGDHRIAMALAVAGLGANGPVRIWGAEAVAKSYPGFFRDLQGCRPETAVV